MPAPPQPPSEHSDLDALLRALIAEVEGGAPPRIRSAWESFERALSARFDRQERTTLADLLARRPLAARVLMEERRYLRDRLARLGGDLPRLTASVARTFRDELEAHDTHEQRVLGP